MQTVIESVKGWTFTHICDVIALRLAQHWASCVNGVVVMVTTLKGVHQVYYVTFVASK